MSYVTGLQCVICKKIYDQSVLYTCPKCGIDGILDVLYDYKLIKTDNFLQKMLQRPLDHWRYRELLPIEHEVSLPPLHVGWSPIYNSPRVAKWTGIHTMWLKDDGRNPTASMKDRASSVGVIKCKEFGYNSVACASTGNAASSLAGMAASMGIDCYIFVPERVPEAKVTQLLIFGATVLKIQGSYEDAFDLCMAACNKFGWYNRSGGINAYLVEGKKTCGLEIAEQLQSNIPDWLAVSVGDGCSISGIWKGLYEMFKLGFIDRLPKLLGVQAEGAQPILIAFLTGNDLVPTPTNTLADSIAVGTPRNWRKAIRSIVESKGTMLAVNDEEILAAMRVAARLGGVFGEPAGVTGLAGIKKAVEKGIISHDESVLTVITGNGLKDVQSAQKATGKAFLIPPKIEALQDVIAKIE